jgi:NAD(P)-dependent dehydrogenase (short-subunit alcohol dehydrogenase family)
VRFNFKLSELEENTNRFTMMFSTLPGWRVGVALLLVLLLLYRCVLSPLLYPPPTSLKGRRILITGAAHGIGAEVALGAAAAGARLILWDLDGAALRVVAERARAALRGAGVGVSERDGRAVVVAEVDVASPAALAAAQGEALRLGSVDSLVCSAAVLAGVDARALPTEQFARVLAVNVGGPAALVRLFLPHLEAGVRAGGAKGSVVLLSSVMGSFGAAKLADYCASKAALEGFAACLRQEVNRDGLRGALGVHVLLPWLVDTGMFGGAFARAGCAQRALLRAFPPQRPADVAAVVLRGLAGAHGEHRVAFAPAPMRWVVGALRALALAHLGAFDWAMGVTGGASGMAQWRGTEHNARALGASKGGAARADSTPRRRR